MRKVIQFDSGLKLVLSTNDAVRSVAIGVFVGAGVVVEAPEQNGISHFIEHMSFKGTKKRSAYDIVREMDAIGAQINASTSKSYTCYYTTSLDTNAEKCMDVLADMYFNATFDKVELERERKVIYEEIDECEDDPFDVCSEHASSEALKGTPYEKTILGTKDSLAKLTSEDLKLYHDQKYVANNTVLSISGNLTEEQAVRLAKEYFEAHFDGNVFVAEPVKRAEEHESFESVDKKIEQAHVILTFPSFEYGDERFQVVNLLTNVFCSEMSSRLFQSVREKLGLCYSIGGYPAAYRNNGYYVIYTSTNKQSVEKAVKAIRKEIDLLLADGITDDELSMGKEKLKTALVLGQESTYSIMKAFGARLIMTGKLLDIDAMIDEIDAIEKDDVLAVAREIFGNKNVCATLVSNGVKTDVLKVFKQ
ncbi:MAG: insulinase family protein [Clostridia bacterium]|nr:insulinase family protein [Clostridia bacterium]